MKSMKNFTGWTMQLCLFVILSVNCSAQVADDGNLLKSVQVQMISPFFLVNGTLHHYDTVNTVIHAYGGSRIYELPYFEDTADVPGGYGGLLKYYYLYTPPRGNMGFRFEQDTREATPVDLDSQKPGLWIFNITLDTMLHSGSALLQKQEERERYLVPNTFFKEAPDTVELHFTSKDYPAFFRLAPGYEAAAGKRISRARILTSLKKMPQGNKVIEPFQIVFTLSPASPQDPAGMIRYFKDLEKRDKQMK